MFWSVVFVWNTGTLLAFGVTQLLFTTKACGKLWCTACSTVYDWPFSIVEAFPGTVSIEFPGIQIGSLSMPICSMPTGLSRKLLKFWYFFIHYLSIQVGSNRFSVYKITLYDLINHSWSNICIVINTQLGEQQWVYILWALETIEYFCGVFLDEFLICQLYQVPPNNPRKLSFLFGL